MVVCENVRLLERYIECYVVTAMLLERPLEVQADRSSRGCFSCTVLVFPVTYIRYSLSLSLSLSLSPLFLCGRFFNRKKWLSETSSC